MNLNYGAFEKAKGTIGKLLASNIIQEFKDTLIIADIKEPFDKVDAAFVKGFNTIAYKYSKKAEERISDEHKTGYNTTKEVEEQAEERVKFLLETNPTSFDFKPISDKTIELLFEGTPEIIEIEKDGKKIKRETGVKLNNINAHDIAMLNYLGLRKTKPTPKKKK